MLSVVLGLLTATFFASTSLISSRAVKVIGSGSSLAWTMAVGLVITVPFVAGVAPLSLSGGWCRRHAGKGRHDPPLNGWGECSPLDVEERGRDRASTVRGVSEWHLPPGRP